MYIQLQEYPIPRPLHFTKYARGNISGTKRGIIDPLVSKRPEQKLKKDLRKIIIKNCIFEEEKNQILEKFWENLEFSEFLWIFVKFWIFGFLGDCFWISL